MNNATASPRPYSSLKPLKINLPNMAINSLDSKVPPHSILCSIPMLTMAPLSIVSTTDSSSKQAPAPTAQVDPTRDPIATIDQSNALNTWVWISHPNWWHCQRTPCVIPIFRSFTISQKLPSNFPDYCQVFRLWTDFGVLEFFLVNRLCTCHWWHAQKVSFFMFFEQIIW